MKLITSFKSLIVVFLLISLNSCSKEYETETFPDSALVTVKLQGLSSQLTSANIDVTDIQFQIKVDETEEGAWVSLNTVNMGVHDLTQITGNSVVTLVDFDEIDLGTVYGLKVVLGEDNSIVKNGITYQLSLHNNLPNEAVNLVNKDIQSNMLYEFIIEFDIDASVILNDQEAHLSPKTSLVMRRFELF